MTELKKLFDLHGSDKASKHKYDIIYEKYMKHRKTDKLNLLEIGVFKGDSIKVWLDYFPNATIYGIDIFVRIKPEDIKVLSNPRVKWAKCNSTNVDEVKQLWKDIKFDFIIDDGLHTPKANRKTFVNFNDKLKSDGKFFIEDVFPIDIMSSIDKKNNWFKSNPKEYNEIEFELFNDTIKQFNHERYDHRQLSGQPDSYMYVIDKVKI